MKAVVLEGFGGPEVLKVAEVAPPAPGSGQVLIRVAATSVNRPDLMQRQGRYPPPPGESEVLGLEIAGTIAALGAGVRGFEVGERVLALVGGGAYAELATAHAGHVMRIPATLSFAEAACICEAYVTAYMNVFMRAKLSQGESTLIHGGGGGVGTAAIQLCKALNSTGRVFATASAAKLARLANVGADAAIDYKSEDFAAVVLAATGGRGVDVILDHIGGPTLAANLKALAVNGRLAIIATMGGREASLDLTKLMIKRQTITGSVLRPRPVDEKAAIIAEFERVVMPLFAAGCVKPIIHEVYALGEVANAHRAMEANEHFGKIVLAVSAEPVGAASAAIL
jgi:putative PIG3 family NAD(P)H quinone oxidoreductase